MERCGVEKPCELLEVLLEKAQDFRNSPQLHGGHAAYDSLDYEIVESEVYKKDLQAGLHVSSFHLKVVKWLLAGVVGLLTGITGFAINLAVENISAFKFLKTTQYMENIRLDIAYAILVASNLVLVLISGLLCTYIAPAAAGSGIPDVKAYLNGVNIPDILAPKTLFVKIFGTIGSVAGGLSTGKQGPLVHIGACIAAFLNQAGVAAAFRAHVGGVLFAVEEVEKLSTMESIFYNNNSGYCASNSYVVIEFGLEDLISVIMLGLIGGVMGSALTYASGKIILVYNGWHRRYGSAAKILHGIAISLITSTCAIGIPWMSSCTACPSDSDDNCPTAGSYGNFKHFICPDGYYND
ncbi:hypothetical protein L7F22_008061 [Adiantum nelumboides]|nr:hypothetical protein [Adiantum nelumboides]